MPEPLSRAPAVCAILIGLPGAGKTTFCRSRLAGFRHISKDLLPHARHRQARQEQLLREALTEGVSVAVDNTNPAVTDRAPLIAIARAHGARVIGYYIEASTREAVARNARRAGSARVPNVAIFTCAKRLAPPSLDEGFDEVRRFVASDDGGFAEVSDVD